MDPKKGGKLFIVLMISLVAFGCGSFANVLNSGANIAPGLVPSSFALVNDQQIMTIGDSSFDPVYVLRHYTKNATNTTNNTTKASNRLSDTQNRT